MRLFEYIPVQKELFAYVFSFRSYVFVKFVNIENQRRFWAYMAAGLLVHCLNNSVSVGPIHTKEVSNLFYTDQASAWNRYEIDISHPRLAPGPQSCRPV